MDYDNFGCGCLSVGFLTLALYALISCVVPSEIYDIPYVGKTLMFVCFLLSLSLLILYCKRHKVLKALEEWNNRVNLKGQQKKYQNFDTYSKKEEEDENPLLLYRLTICFIPYFVFYILIEYMMFENLILKADGWFVCLVGIWCWIGTVCIFGIGMLVVVAVAGKMWEFLNYMFTDSWISRYLGFIVILPLSYYLLITVLSIMSCTSDLQMALTPWKIY